MTFKREQTKRYYVYGYYTTLEEQYRRAIKKRIDKFLLTSFRRPFRDGTFIEMSTIKCQATGITIRKEDCQVDHILPFKILMENFLEKEGLTDAHLEELFLYPRICMSKEVKEECVRLRNNWIAYHNDKCELRAVHKEFNLKRLKSFIDMKTMSDYDSTLILELKRNKYKFDTHIDNYRILKLLHLEFLAYKKLKEFNELHIGKFKHIHFLTPIQEFELSRLLEIDCV